MLFSRSACTCMIPESLTLQRSTGSCATYGALFTLGYFSGLLRRLSWLSTLMLTRLVVLTCASLPRALLCSSVTIWSRGLLRGSRLFLAPVQKPSIALLPMLLHRLLGCASFSRNFTLLSIEPSWSTVTISAPCTCPPTPFNISAPSTSRSTSTSFASGLPLVMFVFFMCRPRHSTPTSSPRAFPRRSSLSSGPV